MTKHQSLSQVRIVSRERTLEDAAAMAFLSPDNGPKLTAAIRQYAEELQAARAARYGHMLNAAIGSRD